MRTRKRARIGKPLTGSGKPHTRFLWLMREVEKRFPNPAPFSSSIPPEVACIAQMDIERAELVNTLDEVRIALNDWVHTYAPELCNQEEVAATGERLSDNGTLYYIARMSEKVSCEIKRLKEKHHDY
jgi:hypothetical protein